MARSNRDVIQIQDSLKKDVDFDKPDDELSPEQLVKKMAYGVLDEEVAKVLSADDKKIIDDARRNMDRLSDFNEKLVSLTELGKEIERNFIWQQAGLILHFSKNGDNKLRTMIDAATTSLVDSENQMSPEERIDLAKTILKSIDAYKDTMLNELRAKRAVLTALLSDFEKRLQDCDFDAIEELDTSSPGTWKETKANQTEWLRLSKELLRYRQMACEAVVDQIKMDEIIPRSVIDN